MIAAALTVTATMAAEGVIVAFAAVGAAVATAETAAATGAEVNQRRKLQHMPSWAHQA